MGTSSTKNKQITENKKVDETKIEEETTIDGPVTPTTKNEIIDLYSYESAMCKIKFKTKKKRWRNS